VHCLRRGTDNRSFGSGVKTETMKRSEVTFLSELTQRSHKMEFREVGPWKESKKLATFSNVLLDCIFLTGLR
jgi:hypothetical protein